MSARTVAIARGARTNLALLGLLAVAFITGWIAFAYATDSNRYRSFAYFKSPATCVAANLTL